MSTGRGAGGRAKQLEEAEEDFRGRERWGGRAGGGAGGGPEGHYGRPQQAGEAPPGAGGAGGRQGGADVARPAGVKGRRG